MKHDESSTIPLEEIREHFDALKSFESDVRAFVNTHLEFADLAYRQCNLLQVFPFFIQRINLDQLEKRWKECRGLSMKQFLVKEIEEFLKQPLLLPIEGTASNLIEAHEFYRLGMEFYASISDLHSLVLFLMYVCRDNASQLQEGMLDPPARPGRQGEQKKLKAEKEAPEVVSEPEGPEERAPAAAAAAAVATVATPMKKPWEKLHTHVRTFMETLKSATDPRAHPGAVERLIHAEAYLDNFSRLLGRFTLSIRQGAVNRPHVAAAIAGMVRTGTLGIEQLLYAIKHRAHPEDKEKLENPHDFMALVGCSEEELKGLPPKSHRFLRYLNRGGVLSATAGQLEFENDTRDVGKLLVTSLHWSQGDAKARSEDLVQQVAELYEGVYGTVAQLLQVYSVLTKQAMSPALKKMDLHFQAIAKERSIPAGAAEALTLIQPPEAIKQIHDLMAKYAAEDKERSLDPAVVHNLLHHLLPNLAAELAMPLTAQSMFLRYSETLLAIQCIAEDSLDLCLAARQVYLDMSKIGHDLMGRVRLLGVLPECTSEELALIKMGQSIKNLVRYFEMSVPQDNGKEKEEWHLHAQVKRALRLRHQPYAGIIPERNPAGFESQAGPVQEVQELNRELIGMVNSLASLLLKVRNSKRG